MTTFSITPIGTCRITTPFRRACKNRDLRLNLSRHYGFVHTSREALQQVRFLDGQTTIPDRLQCLLMRPNLVRDWDASPHVRSDLYFVEISSLKEISIEGVSVQLNYTTRHFHDFFSDSEHARQFWSMSQADRLAERRSWLSGIESFQRLNEVDRERLAGLQQATMTEEEIERDMVELVDLLGRERVVFVTHVNALTPDNEPIPSRIQLGACVRDVARRIGVPSYDPTPLMLSVGQKNAMERGGLDLTHFTAGFCDRLFEDWNDRFLAGRFACSARPGADRGANELSVVLAKIEALLDEGSLVEASRLLWHATRQHGPDPGLSRMHGWLCVGLGDYEGAITRLEQSRCDRGASDDDDIHLMRAHFELGHHGTAWAMCKALLSDEIESPETLRIGAISSRNEGLRSQSISLWQQLLHGGHHVSEAIRNLIALAADEQDRLHWARQGLKHGDETAHSFETLWNHHLLRKDHEVLAQLIEHASSLGEEDLLRIAAATAEQEEFVASAWLVSRMCEPSDSEATAPRDQVRDWAGRNGSAWLDKGLALLEEGRVSVAMVLIEAAGILLPKSRRATAARRTLGRALRDEIRDRWVSGDYDQVMALTARAYQVHCEHPEFHLYRARAATEIGDDHAAREALQRAAEMPRPSLRTLILYARASVKSEAYRDALSTYKRVVLLTGPEEPAAQEARQALKKLQTRAFRHARDLIQSQEFPAAWRLLNELESVEGAAEKSRALRKRVLSELRRNMREIEADDEQGRQALARRILDLEPLEPTALKFAAISAMRMNQFDESLEHWTTLRGLGTSNQQLDRQIDKCRSLLERARQERDRSKTRARSASMKRRVGHATTPPGVNR